MKMTPRGARAGEVLGCPVDIGCRAGPAETLRRGDGGLPFRRTGECRAVFERNGRWVETIPYGLPVYLLRIVRDRLQVMP